MDTSTLEGPANSAAQQVPLFETIASMGHEQLVLCQDAASGYRGIIAIHSTVLGPALGGICIAALGFPVTYTLDVLSFFVSLVSLAMIRSMPSTSPIRPECTERTS